jgi:two-component system chemotaxis response regulator CheB
MRPAIDVLFRSAAIAYRQKVIGIILSGMLDDGTAGLFYVKRHGGIAIVQDPDEARFKGMPQNALLHVKADYKMRSDEIGLLLNNLAMKPIHYPAANGDLVGRFAANGSSKRFFMRSNGNDSAADAILSEDESAAKPSVYSCPDCHGNLYQINDGSLVRFRCRVGHAYSSSALTDAVEENIEQSLQAALYGIDARVNLLETLAEAARHADKRRASSLSKQTSNLRKYGKKLQQMIRLYNAENAAK